MDFTPIDRRHFFHFCLFWCYELLLARGGETQSHTHTYALNMHKGTSNPNKWWHNLRAISTKIDIISLHRMDLIKNSSDLSSGRRPISKSDEFSIRSILVLEITGREFDTFPKNVYTYWDFGSRGRRASAQTLPVWEFLASQTLGLH